MDRTDSSVLVAGPVVVLAGRDLEAALTAVVVAQRNLQRNRLPDNPAYRRLAGALRQAMSACPQEDRPKPAVTQTDCRWLTVKEAAEMMGYSTRHTRRLAERGLLNADKSTGRHLIPEPAVLEHVGGQTK